MGIAAWAVGFAVSYLFYKPGAREDAMAKSIAPLYNILKSKLYFDEIYGWYVEKIQQRVAVVINFIDSVFIGGLAVRGSAGLVGIAGIMARSLHSSNVQNYIMWFLIGVGLFWAFATGVL
jgi:NADH-quinone oxidoreductase subunit L